MSSTTTTAVPVPAAKPPKVFITSATGTQGLSLVHALRSHPVTRDWTLVATTRDLASPAALRLASLGVLLTQCAWDDAPALKTSLAGSTYLFLNTVPSFTDPLLERRRTSSILSLAKEAGISHAIFSSALTINRLSELAAFKDADPNSVMYQSLLSKTATEQTLKETGFRYWTILRGASFMENYLQPKVLMYGKDMTEKRIWRMACSAEDKIPLVDTRDIAQFAVAAFLTPDKFHQKEIPIAGEELSIGEIARQLSDAIQGIEEQDNTNQDNGGDTGEGGRKGKANGPIQYLPYTAEEIEQQKKTNPFVRGQLAIRELGKFVRAEEVKKEWEGVAGIGKLANFGEFLERERDALKETYCI